LYRRIDLEPGDAKRDELHQGPSSCATGFGNAISATDCRPYLLRHSALAAFRRGLTPAW
jgi:hypothetical protein